MRTTAGLRLAALLVTTGLLAGACGGPGDQPARSTPGPDTPVASTPGDSSPAPAPSVLRGAQRTEPRPGMAGVTPIAWQRVRQGKDPRTLHVFFWSGVEPCHVLDHVDVKEKKKSVTITLFQGHDPEDEDTACIEIAVKKVTTIELEAPLGDREVIDGAKRH